MNLKAFNAHGLSNRSIIVLLLGSVAGMGSVVGMTFPLISLTLERLNFGTTLIGINSATASLGILFVGLVTGRLLHRFGVYWPLFAAAVLAIGSLIVMPLFNHAIGWFLLRFTLAAGLGFLWLLNESWLNTVAGDENRGRVIGFYSAAFSGGFAAGPLIITATGSAGLLPFMVAAAIVAVASAPLLLLSTRNILAKFGDATQLRLFRIAPIIFLIAFAAGLFETTSFALLPIFTLHNGFPETESLYALSAFSAGGIALQYPLGQLADAMGRRLMMVVTASGILLGVVVIPFAISSPPLLLVTLFIWGGMVFGLYTLGLILLGDKYNAADIITANATFIIFYVLGAFVGPSLSGVSMDLLPGNGFSVFLLLSATAFAVLTGYHLMRQSAKDKAPRKMPR